jgi:hypothetical protein
MPQKYSGIIPSKTFHRIKNTSSRTSGKQFVNLRAERLLIEKKVRGLGDSSVEAILSLTNGRRDIHINIIIIIIIIFMSESIPFFFSKISIYFIS